MANNPSMVRVEVCYASDHSQKIIAMSLPLGVTVEEAIIYSGILDCFKEIDLSKQKVGIFSKICALDDTLKEGDRIEIYRPLLIDPKEARRLKAKRNTT